MREELGAFGELGGVGVVSRVGDPRERVVEAERQRRSGVAVLTAESHAGGGQLELAGGYVAHDEVLLLEWDGVKRFIRDAGEDGVRGSAVEQLPGAPDRGVLAQTKGGEIGQPGDMVEMEVGEQDVESLHTVEEAVPLNEPRDAGARVDHDRGVAVPQQRARGVPLVCRKPPSPSEDCEHRVEDYDEFAMRSPQRRERVPRPPRRLRASRRRWWRAPGAAATRGAACARPD